MINLTIKNFKCFYDIAIPLKNLSVFAGSNGNGKSTAIQAMLFLRRTIEHCAQYKDNRYQFKEPNGLRVELNGAYCLALGSSNHVLSRNAKDDKIALGFHSDDKTFSVNFSTEPDQLWLNPINVINEFGDNASIFLQEFYYLNAERIGPRINQSIKFYDFPNTGYQGEFVAQLIADTESNYSFKIDERRKNKNSKSPRLEQQVNAWLDQLMPGVSISASYDSGTHSAQIKVENYYTKGDPTIATNLGFGISYVLPIIVTGLIAKEGSLMVVENPEAHLHPSAQSRMGHFLSVIAASGVRVIVETHSDHVLNGIQVAVASKSITSDSVIINYFNQSLGLRQPNVLSISLNELGELSEWPEGFFDQSQQDYASLLKLRRNG